MKHQVAAQDPWHGAQGENSSSTCTTTCITTSTSTSTIPEDDQKDEHPGARFHSQETLTHTIHENWVINLSKTHLTEMQECLLGHGPNFVLVPKDSTSL